MLQKISLSSNEQQRTFSAIETCYQINNESDFHRYVSGGLGGIILHEYFAYGVASNVDKHVHSLININFPSDYLSRIIPANGVIISPTFRSWQQTGAPRFHDEKAITKFGLQWRALFRDFNMQNVGGHGIRDMGGGLVTYFGFGNIERPWCEQQAYQIELIIPHLHETIKRISGVCVNSKKHPKLSTRQQEVLKWIAIGKSSWDIGVLLGVSEKTVKIHTAQAMKKLDVHTRAHAVAKAITTGMIAL